MLHSALAPARRAGGPRKNRGGSIDQQAASRAEQEAEEPLHGVSVERDPMVASGDVSKDREIVRGEGTGCQSGKKECSNITRHVFAAHPEHEPQGRQQQTVGGADDESGGGAHSSQPIPAVPGGGIAQTLYGIEPADNRQPVERVLPERLA